jgi:hypothetical protein
MTAGHSIDAERRRKVRDFQKALLTATKDKKRFGVEDHADLCRCEICKIIFEPVDQAELEIDQTKPQDK